jgi:hypothetical protein
VSSRRKHSKLLRASVLLLLPLLALSLTLGACGGGDEASPSEQEDEAEEPSADESGPEESVDEDSSVTPLPRNAVEVYFPSALENGLVGEFREIFATTTPGDRAKQIIADLISGPTSPEALRALPPDVRLRQAFVLDTGVAYLDFNAALAESIGGGSMEELLAVYSIVDSVVLNIPEIRRVGILVNGRPLETLNGHVDLRRPLPADSSLILGSIIVRGAGTRARALLAATPHWKARSSSGA